MATVIRTELSKTNKYYISKHRRLELTHFCLQYKEWRSEYIRLNETIQSGLYLSERINTSNLSDVTAELAIKMERLSKNIELIDKVIKETDNEIDYFLFKGVTEGMSYNQLKMKYDIPCGKDLYYDRLHKFYWLLDKYR